MSHSDVLTIHIDGAARGNPGPAAFAYVITSDGRLVAEEAGCLGSVTNNVAEYTALVRALERAAELGGRRLHIRSDSELLVKQMNGEYRVKNEQLRELFEEAKRLSKQFDSVAIRHVPREENSHADRLCNEALDGEPKPKVPGAQHRQRGDASKKVSRQDRVREEAVRCLQAAAAAWSRGGPQTPSPEQVWDQLWSILEENGIG